jgi:hypothetical protein
VAGFITDDGATYLLNLFADSEPILDDYYVALITGMSPGISIFGSELEEPAAESYNRARYQNISGNWQVVNGVLSNAFEINFPRPTSEWGFLRHWALCEAPSAGRVFLVGDLPLSVPVIDEAIYFPPGGLTIEFSLANWSALT